jgi:hypothetical protein
VRTQLDAATSDLVARLGAVRAPARFAGRRRGAGWAGGLSPCKGARASLPVLRVDVLAPPPPASPAPTLLQVASKAEEMLGRQDAMDGKLDDVAGRVDEVNDGVAVLQHQVAYTNNAVTLLCGALAEVAKRVGLGNGRYVRAVDSLVHGAPPQQQFALADGGAIPLLAVSREAGEKGGLKRAAAQARGAAPQRAQPCMLASEPPTCLRRRHAGPLA